MKFLIFLILLLILPFVVYFWIKKIKSSWVHVSNKNKLLNSESEILIETNLSFIRDIFLAVLIVSLNFYILYIFAEPIIHNTIQYFYESAEKYQNLEPLPKGVFMDPIFDLVIRILLALSAFLITFGVSSAFLIEIFPWQKGSRFSNVLSFGTAFLLASLFALWLLTSKAASENVIDQLSKGFLGVLTTFLSILFIAITVYFFWKKIKTYIKPKQLK